MAEVGVTTTAIPGLLLIDLPVHHDARGWFKENWQREKMVAAGLPDFQPVQHNVSFNAEAGVTRGLHAEPWDKLVSVATGEVFAAWVDLRPGPGFGAVVTARLGPDRAAYLPRGVANGFQTLRPATTYSYLVNDHWSPQATAQYQYVNLADPRLGIEWPLGLSGALISQADQHHPNLDQVRNTPVGPGGGMVIIGGNGQLALALSQEFPQAVRLARPQLDLSDPTTIDAVDWTGVRVVLNAAAYTAVDEAESPAGRRQAWRTNVEGLTHLVEVCRRHQARLVHFSSDYVFDGTTDGEYREGDPLCPLGVYGQTKAAGDQIVATLPGHLIIRTSWVVGEGKNFVATMARLARKGASPDVVDDQWGRPTFTADLASATSSLLMAGATGVVNVSNDGPTVTWAGLARATFEALGEAPAKVHGLSSETYAAGKDLAARPRNSRLSLERLHGFGVSMPDWQQSLRRYL